MSDNISLDNAGGEAPCPARGHTELLELPAPHPKDVQLGEALLDGKRKFTDCVTVIVTTSPIVSHPSVEIIEGALKSFKDFVPELLGWFRCGCTLQ